jgi:hypothetical protein
MRRDKSVRVKVNAKSEVRNAYNLIRMILNILLRCLEMAIDFLVIALLGA